LSQKRNGNTISSFGTDTKTKTYFPQKREEESPKPFTNVCCYSYLAKGIKPRAKCMAILPQCAQIAETRHLPETSQMQKMGELNNQLRKVSQSWSRG
jgi:hypothetical protein